MSKKIDAEKRIWSVSACSFFSSLSPCRNMILSLPSPSPSTSASPPNSNPLLPCKKKKRTYINSHIAQLWPTHRMIQIILAKVVLGQVCDIRKLHVRDILWTKNTDIHLCFLLFLLFLLLLSFFLFSYFSRSSLALHDCSIAANCFRLDTHTHRRREILLINTPS